MIRTNIDIISVHGAPRSGTSWLGQILNSSPDVAYRFQPFFSYAFKNRLTENASDEITSAFFDDLLATHDEFVLQTKNVSGHHETTFKKNHPARLMVLKEVRYHYLINFLLHTVENLKVVGIVRHPCAVINSWLKAPREFKSEWNELEEWQFAELKNENKKEEYFGFGKWKELTSLFLDLQSRFGSRFLLVNYDKLVDNTEPVTKEIFKFCGLEMQQQTRDFIKLSTESSSNDPYSVLRGKNEHHSWKTELNPVIANQILKELRDTPLNQFI